MAVGSNGEVGKKGNKFGLPWGNIPEDMKYFRDLTTNQVVVMGSPTYKDCGPLPNRGNIVCSRDSSQKFERAKTMGLQEIRELAMNYHNGRGAIFVLGGPTLAELLRTHYDKIYITRIEGTFDADVYMDVDAIVGQRKLVDSQKRVCEVSGYALEMQIYK